MSKYNRNIDLVLVSFRRNKQNPKRISEADG